MTKEEIRIVEEMDAKGAFMDADEAASFILEEREVIFDYEEIYCNNDEFRFCKDLEKEFLMNFIFDDWEVKQQEVYVGGLGNREETVEEIRARYPQSFPDHKLDIKLI